LKIREPFLPARQSQKGDGGKETDAPPAGRLQPTEFAPTLAGALLFILLLY